MKTVTIVLGKQGVGKSTVIDPWLKKPGACYTSPQVSFVQAALLLGHTDVIVEVETAGCLGDVSELVDFCKYKKVRVKIVTVIDTYTTFEVVV